MAAMGVYSLDRHSAARSSITATFTFLCLWELPVLNWGHCLPGKSSTNNYMMRVPGALHFCPKQDASNMQHLLRSSLLVSQRPEDLKVSLPPLPFPFTGGGSALQSGGFSCWLLLLLPFYFHIHFLQSYLLSLYFSKGYKHLANISPVRKEYETSVTKNLWTVDESRSNASEKIAQLGLWQGQAEHRPPH